MKIQMFKAKRQTNRFNENQKVFIRNNYANHLDVVYKYRGKGRRYVTGTCDKFANFVGEIKTIDVQDSFAKIILGEIDR